MKNQLSSKSVNLIASRIRKNFSKHGYDIPVALVKTTVEKSVTGKNAEKLVFENEDAQKQGMKQETKQEVISYEEKYFHRILNISIDVDAAEAYLFNLINVSAGKVSCPLKIKAINKTEKEHETVYQIRMILDPEGVKSMALMFEISNRLIADRCKVDVFTFTDIQQKPQEMLSYIQERMAKH